MAPPSPYSKEQKAEALALYMEVGQAEAARRTGIPAGTIAAWANRNGIATIAMANTAQAVAQHKAVLELKREEIMVDWAELTQQSQRRAMEADRPEEVYKLTLSAAIGTDKLELMTGRATSRHEQGADEFTRELRGYLRKREAIAREGDGNTPNTIDCESTEVEALSG